MASSLSSSAASLAKNADRVCVDFGSGKGNVNMKVKIQICRMSEASAEEAEQTGKKEELAQGSGRGLENVKDRDNGADVSCVSLQEKHKVRKKGNKKDKTMKPCFCSGCVRGKPCRAR